MLGGRASGGDEVTRVEPVKGVSALSDRRQEGLHSPPLLSAMGARRRHPPAPPADPGSAERAAVMVSLD